MEDLYPVFFYDLKKCTRGSDPMVHFYVLNKKMYQGV